MKTVSRSAFVGATFAVLTAGGAMAADLPVKAPPMVPPVLYSWTGFYVGANVGAAWGSDRVSTTTSPANFVPNPGFANQVDPLTPGTNDRHGVIGGVQAGYNWQINSVVVGLEADAN